MFPELYPNRNGLLGEILSYPGLLDRRAAQPPPPPAAADEPRSAGRLASIARALRGAIGGADDPRLSPEQNRAAQNQALIEAGLATLASQGEGLAGVAEGALHGRRAGAAARADTQALAQREKMAGLLSSGNVDVGTLRRLFVEAVAAGDPSAATIGEVLKVMENRIGATGSAPVPRSGVNPATGKPEQFILRPDGGIQWLGVAPIPARPGTTVNVNPEARGMSELNVQQYDAQSAAALEAEQRLGSLSLMESLLAGGMPTGGLQELTMGWRRIGSELGVADAERLGEQQLFKAISNQLALKMKEGMTGPMSDRDIIFLQEQVPRIGNTPEGNKLLIEVLRRVSQRQIDLADLMDGYAEERGGLTGWRAYRSRWLRENPMNFDDLRGPRPPWEQH